MLFSKLEEMLENYNRAKYSPSRSEVHFGCECGCCGDSYTEDSWQTEENEATEAINKIKNFCLFHDFTVSTSN